MFKTTDAITDILNTSETALEALRNGYLNLSAYAEQIQPLVEAKTMKNVHKATIVVALSRISKKIALLPPLKPNILIDELNIKSPLIELAFDKTSTNIMLSRSLPEIISAHSFLTMTEGINEITLITSQENEATVRKHFTHAPKAFLTELVGVSLKFSDKYISESNMLYAILATLAGKRINIIEIVSTYTELTLIINKDVLEEVVHVLNDAFFRPPTKQSPANPW